MKKKTEMQYTQIIITKQKCTLFEFLHQIFIVIKFQLIHFINQSFYVSHT